MRIARGEVFHRKRLVVRVTLKQQSEIIDYH
jgi:hypothetical protein